MIVDTGAETLLRILSLGTVSTNVYLRRIHNFCVDMNWLPWPLIPKKRWPAVEYGDKRAITQERAAKFSGKRRLQSNWTG